MECEFHILEKTPLYVPETSLHVDSCHMFFLHVYMIADSTSHVQTRDAVIVFTQKATAEPFWKDVVPMFQQLSQKELQMFPGRSWEHGWKYTTLICDSQLYMHYLNQRFHEVGSLSRVIILLGSVCVSYPAMQFLALSVPLQFLHDPASRNLLRPTQQTLEP